MLSLEADPDACAGMRQLWQTGWMQQNVRMVVACFLTEYMNMHWWVSQPFLTGAGGLLLLGILLEPVLVHVSSFWSQMAVGL